jgi:hypothetical protein
MAITVFIRYQLDPFKRAAFEEYTGRASKMTPAGSRISGSPRSSVSFSPRSERSYGR